MTVRASWNGAVLAESDRTVVVEGNHYFPPEDVRTDLLEPSDTHTTCPWKGVASYHSVVVDGERNADAAWSYPEPKEAAAQIAGRIAFWHGVEVSESKAPRVEGTPSRRHPGRAERSPAGITVPEQGHGTAARGRGRRPFELETDIASRYRVRITVPEASTARGASKHAAGARTRPQSNGSETIGSSGPSGERATTTMRWRRPARRSGANHRTRYPCPSSAGPVVVTSMSA